MKDLLNNILTINEPYISCHFMKFLFHIIFVHYLDKSWEMGCEYPNHGVPIVDRQSNY